MVYVDRPGGRSASPVVTLGVPLPAALDVRDPTEIGLRRGDGAGSAVAVQTRVLARWGGAPGDLDRPIRWAQVHAVAPDDTELALVTGKEASAAEGAPLAIDDPRTRALRVDTGRLSFGVPRDRFAPLAGLLARTSQKDGVSYARQVLDERGLEVVLTAVERDREGRLADRVYRLDATTKAVVAVRENGPVRTVLDIAGAPLGDDGRPLLGGAVVITLRVTADLGADGLALTVAIDHRGPYGHAGECDDGASAPPWLVLRNLVLRMPTRFGDELSATSSSGTWDLDATSGVPRFRLLQTHSVRAPDDENANFTYEIAARTRERADEGLRLVHRGGRSDGGVLFDDGGSGVFVDVRNFWQQYPAAVALGADGVDVELLPSAVGTRWPSDLDPALGDACQLEGGRGKSWDVTFAFPALSGAGAQTPSDAARRALTAGRERAVQHPVAARVDSAWLARSGALGRLPPPGVTSSDPDMAFALRHLERLRLALVDTRAGDRQLPGGRLPPISIETQRERRGAALRGAGPALDHYGFAAFGDVADRSGFASGRGDLARGLLLAYLAQGDRAFLDRGAESARHRADFDQYHCDDTAGREWAWRNGFMRFPAGAHGDLTSTLYPQGEAPPSPADTWLEGLYLCHALTGDLRCLDAAQEGLTAFLALTGPQGGLLDDTLREPGDALALLPLLANALEQLVAAAEWTGDARAQTAAVRVFRLGIARLDALTGENGELRPPGPVVDLQPFVLLLHPLTRLHAALASSPRAADRATADHALAFLVRVLGYLRDEGLARTGTVTGGLYAPALLPRALGGATSADVYAPFGGPMADACAYVARVTGESAYRDLAVRLLRDTVLFQQAPSRTPLAPAFYAPASFTPVRYAGETALPAALLLSGLDTAVAVLADDGMPGLHEGLLPVYGPDAPGVVRALRVTPRGARGGGDQVSGTGPAAPVRPPQDVEPLPPPLPAPVVLDDDAADLTGDWIEHRDEKAEGGSQRLSLDPDRAASATWKHTVERGGRYQVSLRWGRCAGAATNTRVRVEHADGVEELRVNQSVNAGEWRLVGEFRATPTRPLVIVVDRTGARGAVIADAVRVEAVR